MPLNAIPFRMPEPAQIPAHLAQNLRQMAPADAVRQGLDLLLQIDAAQVILYESVGADGNLGLAQVVAQQEQAAALQQRLSTEAFYGRPPSADEKSLAGRALAHGTALLVMGQAQAGEELPLPRALADYLFDGSGAGNAGFIYVLPMRGGGGRPLGALTLLRPAAAGPLNHEQPNIAEAVRRLLAEILAGAPAA